MPQYLTVLTLPRQKGQVREASICIPVSQSQTPARIVGKPRLSPQSSLPSRSESNYIPTTDSTALSQLILGRMHSMQIQVGSGTMEAQETCGSDPPTPRLEQLHVLLQAWDDLVRLERACLISNRRILHRTWEAQSFGTKAWLSG